MTSGQVIAVTAGALPAGAQECAAMPNQPADAAAQAGGVELRDLAADQPANAEAASGNVLATLQRMQARIGELEQRINVLLLEQEEKDKKELALRRAMLQVMRRIGGMDKDQECSTGKGFYKFRGIDQVYQGMHLLLLDAGLFLRMETVNHSELECMVNNRPGRLVSLDIRYTFCHELGGELSSVVSAEAVGSDDKVVGKAQSYAYKRLMFDTFCIPFEKQMPDESKVEMNVDMNQAAGHAGGKPHMESGEVDEVLLQKLNTLLVGRFDNEPMRMARHMGEYFGQPIQKEMERKEALAFCQGFEASQLRRYLADTLDVEIRLAADKIVTSLEAAFFADYGAIGQYMEASLSLKHGPASRQELDAMCQGTRLAKLRGIAEHIEADLAERLVVCEQVRRLREKYFRQDYVWMLSHLCHWLGQAAPAGKASDKLRSMLAALDTESLAGYAAAAGREMEANKVLRQKLAGICAERFGADYGRLMADMASYFKTEPGCDFHVWLRQFANGQLEEYLRNFSPDTKHEELVKRCLAATDKYFGGKLRDAMRDVSRFIGIGSSVKTFSKLGSDDMWIWLEQVERERGAKAQLIRICERRFGGDQEKLLADMSGFIGDPVARLEDVSPEYCEAYIEAQREVMQEVE